MLPRDLSDWLLSRGRHTVTTAEAAALLDIPLAHVAPILARYRQRGHLFSPTKGTLDFDQWAGYLLTQLHRLVTITDDPGLIDLEREVTAYPNIVELRGRVDWTTPSESPALLIPFRLGLGDIELSMFTTLTTFGTPRDVTLDELAVELFFPNDVMTSDHFHRMASAADPPPRA